MKSEEEKWSKPQRSAQKTRFPHDLLKMYALRLSSTPCTTEWHWTIELLRKLFHTTCNTNNLLTNILVAILLNIYNIKTMYPLLTVSNTKKITAKNPLLCFISSTVTVCSIWMGSLWMLHSFCIPKNAENQIKKHIFYKVSLNHKNISF